LAPITFSDVHIQHSRCIWYQAQQISITIETKDNVTSGIAGSRNRVRGQEKRKREKREERRRRIQTRTVA